MLRFRCRQMLQCRLFFSLEKESRGLSSYSHLTSAQVTQYLEHDEKKASLSVLVPQKPIAPQFLRPQCYHPTSSTWAVLEGNNGQSLESGSVLKVVSWNIDWYSAGTEARATAALNHLQELFGEIPSPFVVMLQEVCRESLQVILENPWVQRNFILSNTKTPESLYTNIPRDSLILKRLDWRASPYFSLLMISRNLAIEKCFRVPFTTSMGRDALVVDIPVFHPGEPIESSECLRLCTTHLESLWSGKAYRPGQLALISTLLKGIPTIKSRIVAGIVGGDMNAIDRSEHSFHRAIDVDLNDVWEDVPAPPIPVLKPSKKDFSYGRAKGNTWGYQSSKARERKRMDKFLYTGSLETVALDETQDVTGRLGRLGIGLKADVDVWEEEHVGMFLAVPGNRGLKPYKRCHSHSETVRLRDKGVLDQSELIHTRVNAWVSDHFGIAVGVKVLRERLSTS